MPEATSKLRSVDEGVRVINGSSTGRSLRAGQRALAVDQAIQRMLIGPSGE
jgi:hypothetical protein